MSAADVLQALKKQGAKIKHQRNSTNPLQGKIIAIALTLVLIVIGSVFYFYSSIETKEMSGPNEKDPDQMSQEDKQERLEYDSLINHILLENSIYIKMTEEGMQKLFYYYPSKDEGKILLSEGDIEEYKIHSIGGEEYKIHSIGGQKYYPLILGYEEAKLMREEELFKDIGDPIKDFFGKNVVIVGILQKTGGVMDSIHLMPLTAGGLN